jgi:hypothetical protein
MQKTERKPLFDLGQLVATPGALAALEKSGQSPMEFLTRHVTGDSRRRSQGKPIQLGKGFSSLEQLERAEGDRRNSEEVHRGNRFPVITEKGKPALGRLRIGSCSVPTRAKTCFASTYCGRSKPLNDTRTTAPSGLIEIPGCVALGFRSLICRCGRALNSAKIYISLLEQKHSTF